MGLGGTVRDSHAHHIVVKQNDDGATNDAFLARSILWTLNATLTGADAGKLNPFIGLWNLAWAPNWSHSKKYSEDVLNRLKKVKNKAPSDARRVLQQIAEKQIAGYWHVAGGGTGDS